MSYSDSFLVIAIKLPYGINHFGRCQEEEVMPFKHLEKPATFGLEKRKRGSSLAIGYLEIKSGKSNRRQEALQEILAHCDHFG